VQIKVNNNVEAYVNIK